jgi:hypothetical protein
MKTAITTIFFIPEIGREEEDIASEFPEALRDHIKSALFVTMRSL